jgi:hypothetical protein
MRSVTCKGWACPTVGDLLVSRDAEALDLSDLVEESGDGVLVGVEGQVADEESVALRADDIAVLLGAISGTGVGGAIGAGLGSEVETHVTALEESTGLLVEGLLGSLAVLEVDVAEAAGPASLLVRDDASADNRRAALELLVQGIVIDAPAEVANPKGGALVGSLAVGNSLCLLGLGGIVRLLLGLPLLGGLLGGGRLLLSGLGLLLRRVGVIRAGGAGVVLIVGLSTRLVSRESH